jgi:hypothetical protein
LSEFLARVVRKGMGRPSAISTPQPKLLPYFPVAAAGSRRPRNHSEDSRLPAGRTQMEIESGEDRRAGFTHDAAGDRSEATRFERPAAEIFPAAPLHPFAMESDINSPARGKASEESRREKKVEQVASVFPRAELSVQNATEHSWNRIRAEQTVPLAQPGAGARLEQGQISPITPVSLSEVRKVRSESNENEVTGTAIEPREMLKGSDFTARNQQARATQTAAGGDSVVQVRIGRVEVRVNAPPAPPAPTATQARGPRGFSEYAAMRRYLTRTRV